MNVSPEPIVTGRNLALLTIAAGVLLTNSCTLFEPPPPPGMVPAGPNRYGYRGTQSPNYSDPRAGQREIKRDLSDNVNIEPPPPRTDSSLPPVESENPPPTTDTSSTPTTPETPPVSKPVPREDLPYGIPVVGKKGFVYSPYAEDRGLVDVEGMKRGTRVECPYTKKHFRVP
jgi:hypothetical protein